MAKRISVLSIALIIMMLLFTACDSSPVSGVIISNQSYTAREDFDTVSSPTELNKEKELYASVYFIESPKGMEYTVKWLMDGEELKTETKPMETEPHGALVFSLESGKLKAGTLKLQILYKEELLAEKEITVV